MQQWFFIHIMKTAGTTLRRSFESHCDDVLYPTENELKVDRLAVYYNQSSDLIQNVLSCKRFIFGHNSFAMVETLPAPVSTAVVLRDPIQRSLSMIHHRKRVDPEAFGGLSEMEILENEWFVSRQIRDYQTKVFAIDDVQIKPNDPFVVDTRSFERACDRLKRIDLIGLTERMSSTIDQINKRCSINLDRQPKRQHPGGYETKHLTAEFFDRLKAEIYYDLKLYTLAKQLFELQFTQTHQRTLGRKLAD